jgi:hypothetical protein
MLRGFRNFLMRGDVIVVAVGLAMAPTSISARSSPGLSISSFIWRSSIS